jgi:hypothetical protein
MWQVEGLDVGVIIEDKADIQAGEGSPEKMKAQPNSESRDTTVENVRIGLTSYSHSRMTKRLTGTLRSGDTTVRSSGSSLSYYSARSSLASWRTAWSQPHLSNIFESYGDGIDGQNPEIMANMSSPPGGVKQKYRVFSSDWLTHLRRRGILLSPAEELD